MFSRLKNLAGILAKPVPDETREGLKRAWARVPKEHRTNQQMYGRHGEGCGATIGMMPRCDFACTGCYLGDEANTIPYESVEAIKGQIRVLRERVGRWGNLQLTDGEVTLRPEAELIEIIQYCKEVQILPMLMTHGDTFRRRPGLLQRLVRAGLREVSIHVDTTQRGRKGSEYKNAQTEEELMPLREEFRELVKQVRAETGVHLRAATTMTIMRENLDEVPAVMRWLRGAADAFDMISFQPMAQVGRTEDGLGGGVTVDALWSKIAEGLYEDPEAGAERLERGHMWLGHPDCNRYIPGVMVTRPGEQGDFHPAGQFGDAVDDAMAAEFYGNFGGLSMRADSPLQAVTRTLGMFLHRPFTLPWRAGRYLSNRLRYWADGGSRMSLLWKLLSRRARTNGFMIVSHHFMSAAEIETPVGRERLDMCVFHVPIAGEIHSMCEVNALGIRDKYYEDIAAGREPGSSVKGHPALRIVRDDAA